jgi:hypothetical protein
MKDLEGQVREVFFAGLAYQRSVCVCVCVCVWEREEACTSIASSAGPQRRSCVDGASCAGHPNGRALTIDASQRRRSLATDVCVRSSPERRDEQEEQRDMGSSDSRQVTGL